jgi:hypothetical protein
MRDFLRASEEEDEEVARQRASKREGRWIGSCRELESIMVVGWDGGVAERQRERPAQERAPQELGWDVYTRRCLFQCDQTRSAGCSSEGLITPYKMYHRLHKDRLDLFIMLSSLVTSGVKAKCGLSVGSTFHITSHHLQSNHLD